MFTFSKLSIDVFKDKLAETASSVADGAKTLSNNVADGAKNLSVTVTDSTKNLSNSIADGLTSAQSTVSSGAEELWAQHGDTVEKIVVDGLIDVAEDKLNDQEFVLSSFETIYELLPTPIRLVISRDYFLRKCFAQKEILHTKVLTVKSQRTEALPSKIEENTIKHATKIDS